MFSKSKLVLSVLTIVLLVGLTGSVLAVDPDRDEMLVLDILTGRVGNPGNFNLFATWVGNDKGVQQLIVDPLWMADYVNGDIINVLADSAPVYSDDFKTITISLREGIAWNDGAAFTADDVVYTIELIKSTPGMGYHTEFNINIADVYKTDDYTVVIELNESNSRFHYYFLDRWGACRILPKHIFEAVEDPTSFQYNPPVGTGPYKMVDYDQAGYWVLYERREDWDKTATGILYGKPAPKYVKFMYYGDVAKKVMAQLNHELDMADLTPESFEIAMLRNDYESGFYADFPYAELLHPCTTGATFNTLVEPFDNKEVRWALNLALNAEELARTAYNGAVAFAPGYIPALLPYYEWFYDDLQPWLEDYTIEVDGEEFHPYNADLPFEMAEAAEARGFDVPESEDEIRKMFGYGWWKYAPDVAEKLLLKNGFTRDDNGKWLLPDGSPFIISIDCRTTSSHPSFKWAFPIADQWSKFGIQAEARPTDQHSSIVEEGDFQVSGAWPVAEPFGSDPDMYRSFSDFKSDYWKPLDERAAGHVSRWYDEDLDVLIEEMETLSFDDPQIRELGIEAAKILIDEQPGISLASYPGFLGVDTYYWTNFPSGDNPYAVPWYHWPNFKFVLPFLEPTGR
ncbi:MAG: ABC transporter substrate-binding protein [Halanaerobiales bacterium]